MTGSSRIFCHKFSERCESGYRRLQPFGGSFSRCVKCEVDLVKTDIKKTNISAMVIQMNVTLNLDNAFVSTTQMERTVSDVPEVGMAIPWTALRMAVRNVNALTTGLAFSSTRTGI